MSECATRVYIPINAYYLYNRSIRVFGAYILRILSCEQLRMSITRQTIQANNGIATIFVTKKQNSIDYHDGFPDFSGRSAVQVSAGWSSTPQR